MRLPLRVWGLGAGMFVVLCLTSATPSHPPKPNAGHVVLKIRANVEDIVLVDPLGRADRDSAGEPLAGIPGCSRWDGGIEEDMEDTTSAEGPDLMVFELASSMYGRYVLSLRAPQPVKVTIMATLDSRVPGVPPCVDLTRSDSVGVGRHCWALDVRQTVPAGECGMRITPMTGGCGH